MNHSAANRRIFKGRRCVALTETSANKIRNPIVMPQENSDLVTAGVLATDLDGTLIPLGEDARQREALEVLRAELPARGVPLVFVTGRHLASVERAIDEFRLPEPDWIICDVGSTLCARESARFQPLAAYQQYLQRIVAGCAWEELARLCRPLDGLRLQEQEKQGEFKLSFYASASQLERLTADLRTLLEGEQLPWEIIASVDPFNGDGLIDLLPAGVSKAHALEWWAEETTRDARAIVFAGDSGNDLAALTAGFRAIVVGNADRRLAQQVQQIHAERGYHNRLHLAANPATSGVLEGCQTFGLLPA